MQYNTLPPCQLFNYQILSLVHKMLYSPHSIPLIFWNYFTPNTCVHSYNTRHNKLYLSQVNSSFGGRLLKFKGSQLWNRLPKDLTDITSFRLFKKRLRVYLTYKPLWSYLISGHNGYLAGYLAIWLYCVILCIEWWCCTILHLHCSFVPCASGHSFPYDIVFQVFTSYTGVQSVSCVLLWQPSECVHLIVNCVILLLENKYDDDDARWWLDVMQCVALSVGVSQVINDRHVPP